MSARGTGLTTSCSMYGQRSAQTSLAMPSYVLVPEELQSRHVWALRLALPVLLSVLGCGIAGLIILTGTPEVLEAVENALDAKPRHTQPLKTVLAYRADQRALVRSQSQRSCGHLPTADCFQPFD